ncbi:MAG: CDP-alcohol phosphatidyltransferase family protein [Bdellovibrionales bacterium]|nr:CDP-alcohol phosphatidyltransferase family protein [Bdellovibrionales bacterium]
MSWRDEFWRSIKSFDTEDKIDLYFYRPAGFLIAKAALPFRITPSQLTVAGMFLGVVAGYLFTDNQNAASLVMASLLFILSGIFDSADGQLARIGGKSSKIGLVLDGICDNLVFASCYIGCIATVIPIYGMKIWPVAIFAGVCHSFQSALLDFYNREYLFFGAAKGPDYWNPSLPEAHAEKTRASGGDRIFASLRHSWIWQQSALSTRTDEERAKLRALVEGPRAAEVQELYRGLNRTVLRLWRPLGANVHTAAIILFAFLQRFELYLVLVDIIGLNLWLLGTRFFQRRQDEKLFSALRAKGLW